MSGFAEDDLRLGVLAATMGSDARVFHVGFVVPSLDEAVASLSDALGIRFAEPVEPAFGALHTPDGPRQVPLRLTYSTRPTHIELIESAPGSLWDFQDQRRGHHVGLWTDDVTTEGKRLEERGFRRLWWADDANGRTTFSYHDTPYGFYIELVDTVAKAFYPGWFSVVDAEVGPA
jgi:catechol 2,3-dioxygenase-like lactoylglutathione lyase family enzyme